MIYDYLIIGAGISGAAAACELRDHGTIALIEAESSPGYHSTGRSAALYTRNFGGEIVRLINRASHGFFQNPPAGFCNTPLLSPRGLITVAVPGDEGTLAPIVNQSTPDTAIDMLTAAQACDMAPLLRPEFVGAATFEAGVADIEVATLHQAYLRSVKKSGGHLVCSMRIDGISRKGGAWHISACGGTIIGKILVNAAGAWADQVAVMSDAAPVGLVAKRRTAIIVDPPERIDLTHLPAMEFADANSYIKPEAGKLMASPGDETPVEPQDVQPEDWDIAVLADWLQRRTFIEVRRIEHSWAGLRTFAADDAPVVGFDPGVEGLFWLAGQGGYGIMMAPALGRTAASLILQGGLPDDLVSLGVIEDDLSPGRFTATRSA
ncbi:MAG: FAD-binding oxidoreductase [Pseudomonadota bacterium]